MIRIHHQRNGVFRGSTPRWHPAGIGVLWAVWLVVVSGCAASCATSIDLDLDGDADFTVSAVPCDGWEGTLGGAVGAAFEGDAWTLDAAGSSSRDASCAPLPTAEDLRSWCRRVQGTELSTQIEVCADSYRDGVVALAGLLPPIPIALVEDILEEMEDRLDDLVDSLEEAATSESRTAVAGLDACAGQMEDVVDGLEYMASRVRLYASDAVQPEGAARIGQAMQRAAAGDEARFVEAILDLVDRVDALRGPDVRADAADAIRSRGDRLIRLCCHRTRSRAVSLDVGATLLGIEWGASCGWERVDASAFSPRRTASDLGITAAAESGPLSVDVSVQAGATDYLDPMKASSDAVHKACRMDLEWTNDPLDLSLGVDAGEKRSPGDVDRQFAVGSGAAARCRIRQLYGQLPGLGLSSESVGTLAEPLDAALEALREERLEDAVDELEDFIDEVHDLVWTGGLSPEHGNRLAVAAWEILPKRTETDWTVPASLALETESGAEITVDAHIGARRIPTNPKLDRRERDVSVAWQREAGQVDVELSFEEDHTDYPNDQGKTTHTSEFALDLSWDGGLLSAEAELSRTPTTYPHEVTKDKTESVEAFSLACDGTAGSLTLAFERSVVGYPNDPGRDGTDAHTWELDADWTLGGLAFDLALDTTRVFDASGAELRIRRSIKLDADWEPTDAIELGIELAWKQSIEWASPQDDSVQCTLGFEISWRH